MADLTKAGVSITNSWYTGMGKQIKKTEAVLTLTGQGTVANAIPAAACGMVEFRGPSVLTKSDNTVVLLGVPSYDKTQLLLKATATNAPADFSGTFKGVLQGY